MKQKKWLNPDRNLYTRATDLVGLLKKLDITTKIKKSSSWDDINGIAIVGVDRDNGYFHWVVAIKDSKRFVIVDPKLGEVLSGEHRIKNKRYKHGVGKSNYISVSISINAVKI